MLKKKMGNFNSFVSDDDHAGGLVGVMLGIVFLIIGIIIACVKENHQPVPFWRRLTGIIIILLGALSFITGIVFVAQEDE